MSLSLILFLIGILGFVLNRKNIILMLIIYEFMLSIITYLILISSLSFDILTKLHAINLAILLFLATIVGNYLIIIFIFNRLKESRYIGISKNLRAKLLDKPLYLIYNFFYRLYINKSFMIVFLALYLKIFHNWLFPQFCLETNCIHIICLTLIFAIIRLFKNCLKGWYSFTYKQFLWDIIIGLSILILTKYCLFFYYPSIFYIF